MAVPKRVIHCAPEILDGAPVFVGTEVPVAALWDSFEASDALGDFLLQFPTVTSEQVFGVIDLARKAVDRHARSA